MNYSLKPFPNDPQTLHETDEQSPDIRSAIASRARPDSRRAIANADLLDIVVNDLRTSQLRSTLRTATRQAETSTCLSPLRSVGTRSRPAM